MVGINAKKNKPGTAFALAAMAFALLALASCDNPLGSVLADEVAYHGAPSRILNLVVPTGAHFSLTGNVRVKEGYPVTINATSDSGYVFDEWTHIAGTGTVEFSAPRNAATEVTVKGGDAVISATVLPVFASVSISPQGMGINVSSVVRVGFNRAPAPPETGKGISVTKDSDSAAVAGTETVEGNYLVFTPDASLDISASYTVTVPASVSDDRGHGLDSPQTWSFTTGDASAPHDPNIVIDSGADWTDSDTVSLELSVQDNEAPYQMRISNSAAYADSDWVSYAATLPWTLTAGDGAKTVYVWFRDLSGNLSVVASDGISVDTVKPTGSASYVSPYTNGNAANLVMYGADGASGSGIVQMRVSAVSAFTDSG